MTNPSRPVSSLVRMWSLCCGTVLMALVFSGCGQPNGNSEAITPETQASTTLPKPPTQTNKAPLTISVDQIQLTDMVMEGTDLVAVGDDRRPVWILSGRIKNNSSEYLSNLRLQIYFKSRAGGAIPDVANLDLETTISPHSVGAFSTRIQMRSPQKGSALYSEVVEARARPH